MTTLTCRYSNPGIPENLFSFQLFKTLNSSWDDYLTCSTCIGLNEELEKHFNRCFSLFELWNVKYGWSISWGRYPKSIYPPVSIRTQQSGAYRLICIGRYRSVRIFISRLFTPLFAPNFTIISYILLIIIVFSTNYNCLIFSNFNQSFMVFRQM